LPSSSLPLPSWSPQAGEPGRTGTGARGANTTARGATGAGGMAACVDRGGASWPWGAAGKRGCPGAVEDRRLPNAAWRAIRRAALVSAAGLFDHTQDQLKPEISSRHGLKWLEDVRPESVELGGRIEVGGRCLTVPHVLALRHADAKSAGEPEG